MTPDFSIPNYTLQILFFKHILYTYQDTSCLLKLQDAFFFMALAAITICCPRLGGGGVLPS